LKERRNLGPPGMLGGPGRIDAALGRGNDGDSEGRHGDNCDIASSSQEAVSSTRRAASVSIEGNRWARFPELSVAATDLEGRRERPGNLAGVRSVAKAFMSPPLWFNPKYSLSNLMTSKAVYS
jgi:hypothetical protein